MSLAAGQQAKAMPFDFLYSTTISPTTVEPGPGNSRLTQFSIPTTGPFSANPPFGSDIVVGRLAVTDLAPNIAYTDMYSVSFRIDVTLIGPDSGQTAVATLSTGDVGVGLLTGTVSSPGPLQPLIQSFNNPFTTPITKSVTIGGVRYEVSIDPTRAFTAPGTPTRGGTGSFGTFTFNVTAVPEPASIILIGIGSIGVIALSRLRKMN